MKDHEIQKPDKELERWREYMCKHYALCHGCPLNKAAREAKLSCKIFRLRRPDEVRFIVDEWRREFYPNSYEPMVGK